MKTTLFAYAIAYATVLFLVGVGLAGGGHGWGGAFVAGVPFTYALLAAAKAIGRRADQRDYKLRNVWVAALIGDVLLAFSVVTEFHYFQKVLSGAIIWLILALAPQIVLWWAVAVDGGSSET